jgi:hypothetical protein
MKKPGRNDPCDCGSGRKLKKCCGAPPKLPQASLRRVCGPCTACCTSLGVPALKKAAGAPCLHQSEAGCAIYKKRPAACRSYRCSWIKGEFGEEDRPDLLGLVIDVGEKLRSMWGDAYVAREVGPSTDPRAESLLMGLVDGGAAVFVKTFEGGSKFLCSDPEKREKFFAIQREAQA